MLRWFWVTQIHCKHLLRLLYWAPRCHAAQTFCKLERYTRSLLLMGKSLISYRPAFHSFWKRVCLMINAAFYTSTKASCQEQWICFNNKAYTFRGVYARLLVFVPCLDISTVSEVNVWCHFLSYFCRYCTYCQRSCKKPNLVLSRCWDHCNSEGQVWGAEWEAHSAHLWRSWHKQHQDQQGIGTIFGPCTATQDMDHAQAIAGYQGGQPVLQIHNRSQLKSPKKLCLNINVCWALQSWCDQAGKAIICSMLWASVTFCIMLSRQLPVSQS